MEFSKNVIVSNIAFIPKEYYSDPEGFAIFVHGKDWIHLNGTAMIPGAHLALDFPDRGSLSKSRVNIEGVSPVDREKVKMETLQLFRRVRCLALFSISRTCRPERKLFSVSKQKWKRFVTKPKK